VRADPVTIHFYNRVNLGQRVDAKTVSGQEARAELTACKLKEKNVTRTPAIETD